MRLEVTIPDQLYSRAARVAVETGVSFDRFLSDAVESRLENESDGPTPTPQLIDTLRKAEGEIEEGKGMTMAQVEQSLAVKRAAWLQANPR